jgi:hypothetical protein
MLLLFGWMMAIVHRAQAASATPPSQQSLFPAAGATNVCVDSPLRIVFGAPPTIGEGRIKLIDAADHSLLQTIDVQQNVATQSIGGVPHFNYHPVLIAGNEVTISFPSGSLSYDKTYQIEVDRGAFSCKSGASPAFATGPDWTFTTKTSKPAIQESKIIVAADGSGDFCTVQGGIDSVPDGNSSAVTLLLRNGVYRELICFHDKHQIQIIGQDRERTVITYANNAIFNPSSEQGYHRGVLYAFDCRGLVLSNLTIRNTTPRGGSQAEAIILRGPDSARAILHDLDLVSLQDTLQIGGQAYIDNCYIEGDVDFMWGRGPCYFENCHCFGTRSKGFFAQVRNPATNHGFVYHHCTFDGPAGVTGMYLNRVAPLVYPHSEMVLMDCRLGPAVSRAGWLLDAAKGATRPVAAPDIHFWEYNSRGIDGSPIDISKRLPASRQLLSPTDQELISHYSSPSWVLGNDWQPDLSVIQPVPDPN